VSECIKKSQTKNVGKMKASYNYLSATFSVENIGIETLTIHEMYKVRGGGDDKTEPKPGEVIPPDED
jgi:hypothetical protein